MSKVETINYQGKDYATVPARLKEFREKNPRAGISTVPTVQPDGAVIFQATIVVDKSDEGSASATGTAMYSAKEMEGKKAFEKLETISVGRALALLGYLNNGEVATGEEMAEFEEYRSDRVKNAITSAETVDELFTIFSELNPQEKKEFTPLLSERKKELADAVTK